MIRWNDEYDQEEAERKLHANIEKVAKELCLTNLVSRYFHLNVAESERLLIVHSVMEHTWQSWIPNATKLLSSLE